jgi:hypothetical protein
MRIGTPYRQDRCGRNQETARHRIQITFELFHLLMDLQVEPNKAAYGDFMKSK